MNYENFEYQLEESRNGSLIPVINGTYLHSIYDPEKEALQWVDEYESQLTKKNNVLVLGLGFGYHIDAIAKYLEKNHEDFNIVILEPNKENISQFATARSFNSTNIKIVCLDTVEQVYSDESFIDFLATKPAVIKHDASYTLYPEIFSQFLAFKSSTSQEVYRKTISDLTQSLFQLNEDHHNDKVEKINKNNSINSRSDFLLMSFLQLSNAGK